MNITMTPLDMQVQQRQLERAIDRQIAQGRTAQTKPQLEPAITANNTNWMGRLAELFLTPRHAG